MADPVHVHGLDGLMQAMLALPKELVGKNGGPVRKALVAAAKVVRDDARHRVAVRTGAVRKNIAYQVDRNPQRSGVNERVRVGVRGGARQKYANSKTNRQLGVAGKTYQTDGSTFYWRFLEFGTEKMVAKPFLRPAFYANTGSNIELIAEQSARNIAIIARKLATKQKREAKAEADRAQ